MIKIKNLTCQYGKETLFEEVDIELRAGLWLLEGENGTGKSTLLNILGNNLESLKKKSLVLKSSEMNLEEEIIFLDNNIEIPLSLKERELYKMIMKINNIRVDSNYQVLYEEKKLHSYSVGERKMAVLKILSQLAPKVLLMDEYLVNLDEANIEETMALLNNMKNNGTIIIVASNDEYLKKMFSSVIKIKNKRIILSEK